MKPSRREWRVKSKKNVNGKTCVVLFTTLQTSAWAIARQHIRQAVPAITGCRVWGRGKNRFHWIIFHIQHIDVLFIYSPFAQFCRLVVIETDRNLVSKSPRNSHRLEVFFFRSRLCDLYTTPFVSAEPHGRSHSPSRHHDHQAKSNDRVDNFEKPTFAIFYHVKQSAFGQKPSTSRATIHTHCTRIHSFGYLVGSTWHEHSKAANESTIESKLINLLKTT